MNVRIALAALVAFAFPFANRAFAHCDGLDGPVVRAARVALETANVNHALIWVRTADEVQIRRAFTETLSQRKLDPGADTRFFETLVRLHRGGEGEPFTGLKPAGRDLGPAIPAADKALETGSAETLNRLLTEAVKHGLALRFDKALQARAFNKDDVAAGRKYVEAYVTLLHYVENLYETAEGAREPEH